MGDRCVPQAGRQWGSLSTASCSAFTSLAKMNNILLQREPVFISLHSSAVIRVQTNASNQVQLAATKGMTSCSRMPLLGPLWTGLATSSSFHTVSKHCHGSFALISMHAKSFLRGKKISPCFKDLMPDLGNEISLLWHLKYGNEISLPASKIKHGFLHKFPEILKALGVTG